MTDDTPAYLKAIFGPDAEFDVQREYLWMKVICDICGDDCTNMNDSGGFIFGSKAYCPKCATEGLPVIKKYKEEHYIRATCPEGVSFPDFVREYRGKGAGNFLSVYTLKQPDGNKKP